MIRTALRLTTIAALTGGGSDYQTLAGKQVHDSRKDDISDVMAGQGLNVIIIHTDEDARRMTDNRGALPGYVYSSRRIALRMDIGVLTSHTDENGAQLAGWPVTDSGMEMMLDLMEYQIENALYGFGPWAVNWSKMWKREAFVSQPLWVNSDSTKTRLAMRELTFSILSNGECFPTYVASDDVVRDTNGDPVFPKTVPEPLNTVLDLLTTDATGDLQKAAIKLKSQILGQDLPVPIVAPMLYKVSATILAGDAFKTEALFLDTEKE